MEQNNTASVNGQKLEKKQLLIIGGGFAGFWSAMSAIRQSREVQKADEVEITLINPDNYFTIRPRLYEVSLEGLRIELDNYLKPLGIKQILGKAEIIDPEKNSVTVSTDHGIRNIKYDYLIVAAGSALKGMNTPGIEHSFNIDTFNSAQKLENHIIELAKDNFSGKGASTFVVVGGGFTGLEAVTSIEEKAKAIQEKYATKKTDFKVILMERGDKLAKVFAPEAQQYIIDSVASKNIEVISNVELSALEKDSATLSNGTKIDAQTLIWTAGMVASPLTTFFNGEKDIFGRLAVDEFLKLPGYDNVIVAGDVANATIDGGNSSVMSCQYSQFEGRWAGHNAINDLFGATLKPYVQNGYVTCLDLGQEAALYTTGRERTSQYQGVEAKNIKVMVNTQLIYPLEGIEETVAASFPELPSF